jgi:hypothetical protein
VRSDRALLKRVAHWRAGSCRLYRGYRRSRSLHQQVLSSLSRRGKLFVEYAVAQGHPVGLPDFVAKCRSETQYLTWDNCLNFGPLRGIDVVCDVAGADRIHVLGFASAAPSRTAPQCTRRPRKLIGMDPRAASGHGDAADRLEKAEERPGGWWPDWDAWMKNHSGGTALAPTQPGSARYPPIEAAPGRYVKQKAN